MKRTNSGTNRNAILYLRYSTMEQADGNSEKRQTDYADKWCRENEAKLAKTYKDLGISGGKSSNAGLGGAPSND